MTSNEDTDYGALLHILDPTRAQFSIFSFLIFKACRIRCTPWPLNTSHTVLHPSLTPCVPVGARNSARVQAV